MTDFSNKQYLKMISIMVLIDILLIGGWVLYLKPDSSVSIILIFAVPFTHVVNLILAAIIFFIKRPYAALGFINSIISPIILVVLFVGYVKIDLRLNLEEWNFRIDNTKYSISYWTKQHEDFPHLANTYGVYEFIDGGSMGDDSGIFAIKNDTIYFYSKDSTTYYIVGDYLYNFKGIEKIRVDKTY